MKLKVHSLRIEHICTYNDSEKLEALKLFIK